MKDTICCPLCGAPLHPSETNEMQCEICGKRCKIDDGFYDFLGPENLYWGEVPQEYMKAILKEARESGWRSSINSVCMDYPDMTEYLQSGARADWMMHCLNPTHTERCLDIGSGWGTNSFLLANVFEQVWSLEAVRERIEFQRIRRMQDRISNLRLVRSDWLELPFCDCSFDLVVANGVLEWIGLSDFSTRPEELQKRFLRRINRILKPSGCLFIGVENRFGYGNFLGARDHSGLPFTAVMPRPIADMTVRLFRNRSLGYDRARRMAQPWPNYRTYTYSLRGYRTLLRTAEFEDVDVYWTTDYNLPKYSGRFDGESLKCFIRMLGRYGYESGDHLSPILRFIGKLPGTGVDLLGRMISPSVLIYAYKRRRDPESIEKHMLELDLEASSFFMRSGSHSLDSKILYFTSRKFSPSRVIKTPRFRSGNESLTIEQERFRTFNDIDIRQICIDDRVAFCEPAIEGMPLNPNGLLHNLMALEWLLEFQRKTASRAKGSADEEVRQLMASLSSTRVPPNILRDSQTQISSFLESLDEYEVAASAEHGDFSPRNLIVDDHHLFVTDWEFFRNHGNAFFDFATLILASCTQNTTDLDGFRSTMKGENPYALTLAAMCQKFTEAKCVPYELAFESIPYAIVRYIHRYFSSPSPRQLSVPFYAKLLGIWHNL